MHKRACFAIGLYSFTVAARAALPACATIDADKRPSVYLVNSLGALATGALDVGVIEAPKNIVVDQAFYKVPFRIVTTPRVVDFMDTCGQGICIKLTKVGKICKKSTLYSVQFAITLHGGERSTPYSLDDLSIDGFSFQAEENGYPAPVDYKFVAKLRGKVVDVP